MRGDHSNDQIWGSIKADRVVTDLAVSGKLKDKEKRGTVQNQTHLFTLQNPQEALELAVPHNPGTRG